MDTASTTPTVDTTPAADQSMTPPVIAPAPVTPKKKGGGWGGLIAIVLIVGLFVTAAFYTWGERLASQPIEAEVAE